ncbi:hypothetical protein MTR_5g067815 [Medicago truncatula]|uniref:Uncharacterized protein n=1 Tax=Medicago truncatula TaxID=3880 RepID=A0A072UEM2_MEDTR|nr:hypothetical protein MTR_5g067815 [Medicago truncatula]
MGGIREVKVVMFWLKAPKPCAGKIFLLQKLRDVSEREFETVGDREELLRDKGERLEKATITIVEEEFEDAFPTLVTVKGEKPLKSSRFGGRFRYGKVLGTRSDYGIP